MLAAMHASRNGRVVAMASRDGARAREMLRPYPGARALDSYDALLEDPQVEAIYNPLPNSLHREWTLRAIAAGKHVLCEKPIALNAGEAEEMAAAAARAGKQLMEAFMYRFHPAMREFVERIREPLHVQATFAFPLKDTNDIRMQAPLGGGALLDVGSYCVSVTRWILGEPVEVAARRDVMSRPRPFTSYRDPHDPYQLMVESFGDSILQGKPVELPIGESIANMRVLDRIRGASAPGSEGPRARGRGPRRR
ncbi:MAG: hypothetical protein AUI15_38460 [Actinobacteria bacterium 13_2_20CM_2_66_6]|nr:MAG: hypothetical protein AUI15_38460 [Actinobacteria bacterium 13_2_20CM_2_66_6]